MDPTTLAAIGLNLSYSEHKSWGCGDLIPNDPCLDILRCQEKLKMVYVPFICGFIRSSLGLDITAWRGLMLAFESGLWVTSQVHCLQHWFLTGIRRGRLKKYDINKASVHMVSSRREWLRESWTLFLGQFKSIFWVSTHGTQIYFWFDNIYGTCEALGGVLNIPNPWSNPEKYSPKIVKTRARSWW